MVLEFKEYKKKVKKNTVLELDLKLDSGEILTIVSNEVESLQLIKNSIKDKVSYKGKILFNDKNASKERLIFTDDFGFYNHLSLTKNFRKILPLFNVNLSKEDIIKIKLHTLFSILINQSLIVVDYSEETLTSEDKHQIRELILSKSNNENIVILDTILNQYNDIADYILVISDNVKSYYGSIDDVLIIRSLVAVSISNHHNLENILKDYQYTVDDEGEVVIREEVLEEVLFELLKNNTEALPQRNNRLIYGYVSERLSVLNEVINANPIYKIKINKTDKVKVTPVQGAVYTIINPEGVVVEDVTTDENGVAVSKELSKDYLGKVFTIMEKLAPKGYKLDPTVYTVTIGENNSIINLQDEPEDTPPTPPTPTPNKPVKPNEPGKPEKPGKPNKPGKPTTPVVKEKAKKAVLPKTGVETNSLAVAGLVIGLGALVLRRKANK